VKQPPHRISRAAGRLYVLVPRDQVERFRQQKFRVEKSPGNPDLLRRYDDYRKDAEPSPSTKDRRRRFNADEQLGGVSAGFIAAEVIGDMREIAEGEERLANEARKGLRFLRKLERDLLLVRGGMVSARKLDPVLKEIRSQIDSHRSRFLLADPEDANRAQNMRIRAFAALGVSQKEIGRREGLGQNSRAVVEQRLRRMKGRQKGR
jgi:hypothetical protein